MDEPITPLCTGDDMTFQRFSVTQTLIIKKNYDFVFLASFSVHFWTPPWFLGWLLMANQFISFFLLLFLAIWGQRKGES